MVICYGKWSGVGFEYQFSSFVFELVSQAGM